MNDREQAGEVVRLAFVQSMWHGEIVDRCRDSFVNEIGRLGVGADRVDLFRVPGASRSHSTPSAWPQAGCTPPSSAPGSSSTGASTGTNSLPRRSSTD